MYKLNHLLFFILKFTLTSIFMDLMGQALRIVAVDFPVIYISMLSLC